MNKSTKLISWILQIIAVVILAQTLPHKFGGSQESIDLFTKLEMEPFGRYLIGTLELLACVLLLIPTTVSYGAFLSAGLMVGAVIGHITKLGFEGQTGFLGTLAIVVLGLSLAILYLRRQSLPVIGRMFDTEQAN